MDIHPSRLARDLPKLWQELGAHELIENCLNEHPVEYDQLDVQDCLMFETASALRQMGLDVRVIERDVSIIETPGSLDCAFTRQMRSLLADGVEWDTEGSPDVVAVFNRWETVISSRFTPHQIKIGEGRDITDEVDRPSEGISAIISASLKLLISSSLADDLAAGLPDESDVPLRFSKQQRL